MTNWCKWHCISTCIFTFGLPYTAPVRSAPLCQGTRASQGSCREDTAPASQSAGHSTTAGQDQQGCLLHPGFLSSFASWRILQSTRSNLAWNALKRGIWELYKANSETPLLQGTKAGGDELKQQSLQLHTQSHRPHTEQRTLVTQGLWLRLGSFPPFPNVNIQHRFPPMYFRF